LTGAARAARTGPILASLAAALLLGGCSLFESEADRGRAVAETWCAECHRIAPDEPTGSRPGHVLPPPVTAPSFMAIAARPGVDAGALRHFMAELHLPMPSYRLSEEERESVIRYILSLQPPKA
jgi:mono/diheme cytochrome c family protein